MAPPSTADENWEILLKTKLPKEGGRTVKQIGKILSSLTIGAMAVAGVVAASGSAAAAGKYDGVTIRILTRPGPVIAKRLDDHGKEFTAATGAVVTVTEVPFAEIFQKTLTDWASGTNSIDVAVLAASWVPELVEAGVLEDLSDYVAKDDKIDLADI